MTLNDLNRQKNSTVIAHFFRPADSQAVLGYVELIEIKKGPEFLNLFYHLI